MSQSIKDAKQQGIALGLDGLDVEVLLAHVLEKTRTYLYTWPDKLLSEAQLVQLQTFFERRQAGEPVAYILGEREFWSLPLSTQPSTLIPRPDTEVLVETVLAKFDETALRCIDLGTGTGAIALALKSERPHWQITGADRVPEAVALATENAKKLQLDVTMVEQNWLSGIAENSFDVIVSNPPYIDADDEHLAQGDVRFEPISALVASNNGLADIELITTQAQKVLTNGGALFFEHGWQQAGAVREILTERGFNGVETVADYGGNDRVSFGFLNRD